jgi:hypothetical protein
LFSRQRRPYSPPSRSSALRPPRRRILVKRKVRRQRLHKQRERRQSEGAAHADGAHPGPIAGPGRSFVEWIGRGTCGTRERCRGDSRSGDGKMIYFHPSSECSRVNQGNLSNLHFCDFSGKPAQHHQRTLNSGVMKAPSRKIILHRFCEHALSRTIIKIAQQKSRSNGVAQIRVPIYHENPSEYCSSRDDI